MVLVLDQVQHVSKRRDPLPPSRIECLQLRDGHLVDRARAVRRTVDRLIVNDDRNAIRGNVDIQFDAFDPELERPPKRRQRVLRKFRRRPVMRIDPDHWVLPWG